uniref:Amino AcidPolyamineOrganocation (APC) Family putati n=1 Tax=Albugo laibachii Nc14 TaxID=890382 RepID=F0W1R3_9STRA|nr:Amino AcidPolyamineOrganocation (APC) Family putati [Albugo laibachii Nc14]|eukprot:CCA14992.1 Amino AcidPolyamineOrganocation (APC) Family putati [Albugo laibachii Nc14]
MNGIIRLMGYTGPMVTVIASPIFGLALALPYSYMVMELCSAFPEDGGFTVWVLNAFGPFWGFQIGYCAWIADTLKMAFVTRLILRSTLATFHLSPPNTLTSIVYRVIFIVVAGAPAALKLRHVAGIAVHISVLLLASLLIYVIWALACVEYPERLTEIRRQHSSIDTMSGRIIQYGHYFIDWKRLLEIMMEIYNGFQSISAIGSGVLRPGKTFPKAIWVTFVASAIIYSVPAHAIVISSRWHWSRYTTVAFADIASSIGATPLRMISFCLSICTNFGQIMCRLLSQSYLLCGMAENELFLSIFANKNQLTQAPISALVFSAVCICPFLLIDSERVFGVMNAFTCTTQILIICTVIRLRRTAPLVARPYKFPGNNFVLVLVAIPQLIVLGFTLWAVLSTQWTARFTLALITPGLLYGFIQWRWLRKKRCETSNTLEWF